MSFFVDTAHPIAVTSNDHLYPRGTKNDNFTNLRFNRQVMKLVDASPLSVLDIGCAGGGMVKSFIDMGQIAVGIEGSDYSKKAKRAAWATIPDNLFTADATKPFTVHTGDGLPYQFDVVTAWEFFEHIKENDLGGVIENIRRHLKDGGLLVATIAGVKRAFENVVYHHTIMPAAWWRELFSSHGFVDLPEMIEYFQCAWVRLGPIKVVMRKER